MAEMCVKRKAVLASLSRGSLVGLFRSVEILSSGNQLRSPFSYIDWK